MHPRPSSSSRAIGRGCVWFWKYDSASRPVIHNDFPSLVLWFVAGAASSRVSYVTTRRENLLHTSHVFAQSIATSNVLSFYRSPASILIAGWLYHSSSTTAKKPRGTSAEEEEENGVAAGRGGTNVPRIPRMPTFVPMSTNWRQRYVVDRCVFWNNTQKGEREKHVSV